MLLHGLRRFALITAGLAGLTVLVALAIVWLADTSASRTFPRAFYFAGAFLAAVAFLGGTGTYEPQYRTWPEQEVAVSRSFVYGAFAFTLIGIGVALEYLL